MNTRLLFLTLLCLTATPCTAGIYQTRDEQGNIIYTDVPPAEDAPEVKLPPPNVLDAPDRLEPTSKSSSQPVEYKYQQLEITSPPNNETFFINLAKIPIQLKLLPELNRSAYHRLQILWDGRILAENQLSYLIAEADRGEHTIRAKVVDKNGQVLISATPVTVHVKQPFAAP